MPIKIFTKIKPHAEIAWLCGESDWTLPGQIAALVEWLCKNKASRFPGGIIADVGFTGRDDAGGGSVILPAESLKIMADIEMDLHLSEYPIMMDEKKT